MAVMRYLREVCDGHERVMTKSVNIIALINLADAVAAWRDVVCVTRSIDTDYVVASMNGQCCGDTHEDVCPVFVARMKIESTLAAIEAIR
jgi:hypothetical protein